MAQKVIQQKRSESQTEIAKLGDTEINWGNNKYSAFDIWKKNAVVTIPDKKQHSYKNPAPAL